MSTNQVFLDPTDSAERDSLPLSPRLKELRGRTVGLLDINKQGSAVFLDRLEELLRDRYQPKEVVRVTKETPSRPAAPDIYAALAERCDAVVVALAD